MFALVVDLEHVSTIAYRSDVVSLTISTGYAVDAPARAPTQSIRGSTSAAPERAIHH